MLPDNPPPIGAVINPDALPDSQTNAGRINIDVQVGPQGVQLVALRAGTLVLARSGWSSDIGAAWFALGHALSPMLLRIANRSINPPADDRDAR